MTESPTYKLTAIISTGRRAFPPGTEVEVVSRWEGPVRIGAPPGTRGPVHWVVRETSTKRQFEISPEHLRPVSIVERIGDLSAAPRS